MRLPLRRPRSARVSAGLLAAGLLVPLLGVASPPVAGARVGTATVFARGEDGYHTFRIPAVVAAGGTLLAFAEGRVDSPSDDGDIDLVLKRSTDGGATWGPLQVVVEGAGDKFGNPVPVLDRTTGRVMLNVTRTGGDVSGNDIRCGHASPEEMRRSFVVHSDDGGATWSDPVEITDDVRPSSWRHFVGGPGHGIQLTKGEHAGRLVIPGNHSVAPPQGSGVDCTDDRLFGAHSLYSDDGGTTWQLGGVDSSLDDGYNPNESTAAELADGTVYFNARDQGGTSPGRRVATTSGDGGASFDATYRPMPDVVTTQIQGSVLALPERLVLSAPDHPTARENLTLWSSLDQTASWQRGLRVHEGPSGYSDLVALGKRSLGVLFENGDRDYDEPHLPYHQRISFARVPAGALDTPAPPPRTTPDVSGNEHEGTVGGSPRVVEGAVGSAFELSGDYVETPLTDDLAAGTGPFTAAAWFRTESPVDQAILWAHSRTDGEPKWWVRLGSGGVRTQLETGEETRSVTAPGDFADDTWHHVALTRDPTGLALYVDGSLQGSAAPVTGSVSAGARTGVRVGARVDGVNDPLRGGIDEVRLFDRALTLAEVSALAAGNTVTGASAHYPMEQVRRAR